MRSNLLAAFIENANSEKTPL